MLSSFSPKIGCDVFIYNLILLDLFVVNLDEDILRSYLITFCIIKLSLNQDMEFLI